MVAKSIVDFFKDRNQQKLVDELLSHVKIEKMEVVGTNSTSGKGNPMIIGKTFVLTGTLESMSRDEAKSKIKLMMLCSTFIWKQIRTQSIIP